MVEYIRSKYLQKILLSSLNEKTKLELIKYNKNTINKMSFNNAKACYFLKILFSYLNERTKLRIINYNKSL